MTNFVVIDRINDAWQQPGGNGSSASFAHLLGPFEYGGSLWEVTQAANLANFPIQVQKSTDGGLTWASQDAANSPISNGYISAQVFSSVIYICYRSSSAATGLKVISFDLATELFGAPTGASPDTGSGTASLGAFQVTAANTFNVVLQASTFPAVFETWFVRYATGAWGTPAQITDVATSRPVVTGFARDTVTGTLHILYSQQQQSGASAISPNPVQHLSIDPSGTVSAPDNAIASVDQTTFQTTPNFATYPGFGEGQVVGGSLFFPCSLHPPAQGDQFPFCLYYDGVSWTLTQIAFGFANSPDIASSAVTMSFLVASTVHIFWTVQFVDTPNNTISVKHVTTTDGVTFSAVDTIDFGSQLPTPPPTFSVDNSSGQASFSNPSCAVLASGALAVTVQCSAQDFNNYTLYFSTPVPPLGIICDSPPDGTVGIAYTHTFPVTNDTPPLVFAIIVGALPGGLSLNMSTGVVSGTPTTPGTFPFTIQVTDAVADTASVACSITITGTPPTITCGSPPAGVYGVPYSHNFSLTTSSGTPPYTWDIISGLLPPGLTLDGATGIVSGTPTTAGFYPFTIQVMDSLMLTDSVDCSITTAIPGIGNLYTLEPTKLTDDDYGRIYPHYVTYFMPSPEVAASAGMASRKMVAYLKSNISGTGIMTITAYPDNLSNPWPLRCSRTLTQMPRFDLEWSGASCVGDRIAVKFESSPAAPPLTDNEFSLQGLSVWARGNARLPVRGRA